jgi:hypothetical protein
VVSEVSSPAGPFPGGLGGSGLHGSVMHQQHQQPQLPWHQPPPPPSQGQGQAAALGGLHRSLSPAAAQLLPPPQPQVLMGDPTAGAAAYPEYAAAGHSPAVGGAGTGYALAAAAAAGEEGAGVCWL